jgi:glycosyltransferase involved in cell wall biosynthesis
MIRSNTGYIQTSACTTVIIPAFNEGAWIQSTVESLIQHPTIFEILVVDDGSTDHTAELALQAGAAVIRHTANRGKAAAVWTGIQHAVTDVLLFCDADLGTSAAGIWPLLDPVLRGEADLTIGILPELKSREGFGIVKTVAEYGIHHCTTRRFQAPLSGQRACRRDLFQVIPALAKGYGMEVGLTIDALRYGFRVHEVPINVTHRLHGRTLKGFVHRGRQLIDVMQALHARYLEV